MKEKTTRLELLKQGAAVCAVVAAGSLLPVNVLGKESKKTAKTSSASFKYDEIFDVIVVGSGLSGAVAAITAAEKGNKVLMVEKMDFLGGSSINQDFHLACPESKEQKQKGIKDSHDTMVKDINKIAENYGNPELVTKMVQNSLDFYSLLDKVGVKFEQLKDVRGHSASRTLWVSNGKQVIDKLHSYLNGKCSIRKQVKVDEILIDDNGRAVGVKVREQYVCSNEHDDDLLNKTGIEKIYGAKKGVILANGGFAFDKTFISGEAKYFGGLSEMSTSAHHGATAGLLKSMILKGAHPVNTSLYHFSYPIYERDFYYGLMVDAVGERLADESNPNKFGRIAYKSKNKNEGKAPVCLFDQTGFDLISDKQKRDAALQAGVLMKFGSIEQLSNEYQLPLATVQKTISDYHSVIAVKKDEQFMKMLDQLNGAAIKKAPFYAIKVEPELNYTTGGLRIDKEARVLKMADETPFNGLFAAGEVTGGTHGAQILEGLNTLDCGVFGLIAGEQASKMEAI